MLPDTSMQNTIDISFAIEEDSSEPLDSSVSVVGVSFFF
jgi:hypothetical protein